MSTAIRARRVSAQPVAVQPTPVVAVQTAPAVKKINVNEIEENDVFSEISHYSYKGKSGNLLTFFHLEGNRKVDLSPVYVENLLSTADQFHKEEVVGREDKVWTQKQLESWAPSELKNPEEKPRIGDLKTRGIRSIWSDIHSSQVFSVCFDKQAKPLTQKRVKELLEERAAHAVGLIEKAKTDKKSMLEASRVAVQYLQENPVSSYEEPEERILRGYKVQFESVNGYYDVIDMDLEPPNNRRKVNINEIKWLGFNGVKYIVEK